MIEGKVGSKKLVWKSNPRGSEGEAVVEINGHRAIRALMFVKRRMMTE